ncbi:uncharacterized protein [Nicotiana tomentosiformis]|uniref:uncharacterized protein n=1 Tax=Nicotiana tomentosiformis TaxID=4098 RepID=UPI00051B3855|nr:proline-, glutamic acid- and leucine-rich protein 1-like [Nicotiana tomentosiformis]
MTKASQNPSKAKSSTKDEEKPKIMKPKSKKSAKPSREPTPAPSLSISSTVLTSSSHVPAALTISASTVPPLPKPTTHAPELTAKNTSKLTKVKSTQRKSFKKVPDAAMQVQHPPLKLDVLMSAIDVAPLDTLPPTSEKPQEEKFTIEKGVGDLRKEVDTTAMEPVVKGKDVDTIVVEPVVEGERSKEPVQKEASDGLLFNWTEDDDGEKSENEGAYGDEKESDTDDKIVEQVNDSAEEKNHSEEEDDSKSKGEDKEKVSESEGGDEESEEEDENVSEESKGSITIGNIVIAPSEKTGGETRAQEPGSLLTPFTGDKEVTSDEDDVPLSEAIKESRSAKKPRKKVSILKPVVELDGEDESYSALPAKSSSPKRKVPKVPKTTTPSTRASRDKTRKNVPTAID